MPWDAPTWEKNRYCILDWPHVQPVWRPNDSDNQYCWLCEFGETDLVFRVMDMGESRPTPVLYGRIAVTLDFLGA